MGGESGNSDSGKPNDSNVETGVIVHIRCSNGSKFSVRTSLESTVGTFKTVLAQNCDVPAEQQRLIFKGRILKDDQTLESYGLQGDQTVHMVRGFAPASATNTTGTANVGGGSNTTPGVGRGVGSNEGAGFGGGGLGASLFPGLGVNGLGGNGVSGLFGSGLGSGLPEFEQVQQQLTQNPNMMREIMNMPVIQNLMNNPDLMRNLIMSNPQMREIIDRNPDLAHILNDPSTLRQTLEAARNPELMREMMRNTDRAMSNIESSPEGFNMLRRMYETVQEPFLNATTMAGDTGNDAGSNPFAALLGSQGGGQARDRSTNSTTTGSETTTGSPAPNTNPLPNPWNTGGGSAQTNTTSRSTPVGDGRGAGIAGLGGLGLPEMERMFSGTQDPASMNQFLQNPAVSQIMQSLLSNPQYMNQILGLNPQLRSMLDSNSQLREMMQNPEFLRQLTSPETMQQVLSLQQSLMSQLGRQQSAQEPGQTGGGTGTPNNMGLELLMNMFGGLGAGSLSIPNASDVPPEQLYATQLSQLQEMGFFDTQENIRALSATAGNVHAAVERLLGNLGQ
ncbi:ubiquitin domain-containing protein DSK2a-like [Macadamia integrifolia]|uniref:ubiquitin domain-containing protein DSK2a-like n=1 Tax=Macadamia integrifolia TaxID=60698 RepID=UPI001C4E8692|nr:ubiquitin domain-containing protein DSK2a-like [Macadamia integrifolia]